PVEVRLEVGLEGGLEPLALHLGGQVAPLGLPAVEVLQDLVEEAAALHLDPSGRRRQTGVVVVPVEAWALEVVVQGRRTEVAGVHTVWPLRIRLERPPGRRVGGETALD